MRELFSLFAKREKQENQEELPAICPYCGEVLAQRPKRKKKCPVCKNPVYVRTDSETGQKILTTEEAAQVMRWLESLESDGISKGDFSSGKARLAKKFRTEPSDRDVIWALLNDLVIRYARISDFRSLQMTHLNMGYFLEEEGRDPFGQFQQASRMKLMGLKQSGCTKVKTKTCNDEYVCPSCRALKKRVFDIDDALEMMPLPNKECTTEGGCRCHYGCMEVFGVSL